jgi:hypothetical protein
MLLLRIKMSETMRARDNVFGKIIDSNMDLIMSLGSSSNKRLSNTAPEMNAWPSDSFFRIRKSKKTNTIVTRSMAGV